MRKANKKWGVFFKRKGKKVIRNLRKYHKASTNHWREEVIMSTPLVGSNTNNEGQFEGLILWGDKWCQLKIPLFSGEDAYGWASKIERYFDLKVFDAENFKPQWSSQWMVRCWHSTNATSFVLYSRFPVGGFSYYTQWAMSTIHDPKHMSYWWASSKPVRWSIKGSSVINIG